MFCLTVQNPRSQNECSQHHKGSLGPESGILDPLGVICSKTEAWGSSFQIPVRVHYHREDPFIIESLDPTGVHDTPALLVASRTKAGRRHKRDSERAHHAFTHRSSPIPDDRRSALRKIDYSNHGTQFGSLVFSNSLVDIEVQGLTLGGIRI